MKLFHVSPPHDEKYRHFELRRRGRYVDSDINEFDAALEFVTDERVGRLPPIYMCLGPRVDCLAESAPVGAAVESLRRVDSFTVPARVSGSLQGPRTRLSIDTYRVIVPLAESGPPTLVDAKWTIVGDPGRGVGLDVTGAGLLDCPSDASVFRVATTAYRLWTEESVRLLVGSGLDQRWFQPYGTRPSIYLPFQLRRRQGGRRLFEQALQAVRESYGADAAELWQREWDEVVKTDGPPVD
jgi:hypothetical protein